MTLMDQEHAATIMVGDGGRLEGYCKQEQSHCDAVLLHGRLCEKFLHFPRERATTRGKLLMTWNTGR